MRGLTLFAGMYGITVTMFYIQSGSIVTGLTFGAMSAALKTVWAKVHPIIHPIVPALEVVKIEEYRQAA